MAKIAVNGTELYYEDVGADEPMLFSHGLLWNTSLFSPQVAAFRRRYRCISYDHRGQGRSLPAACAELGMDLLTDDVVALIAAMRLGPVHFCGLSMGGYVGMRLAARFPHLVRSLILCDTSADAEAEANKPRYRMLATAARLFGARLVVGQVMPLMHGKTALSDPSRAAERAVWRTQLANNRRTIWRAVNGVLDRRAIVDELPRVTAPTLVLIGEEDVATPPAAGERIAAAIAGARLVRIANAGHCATVEQPQSVNAAIHAFLEQQANDGLPVAIQHT